MIIYLWNLMIFRKGGDLRLHIFSIRWLRPTSIPGFCIPIEVPPTLTHTIQYYVYLYIYIHMYITYVNDIMGLCMRNHTYRYRRI